MPADQTTTYAEQFIATIKSGYLDGPLNDKDGLSRIFNGANTQLPKGEINALIKAKENGWLAFGKTVYQQINPFIDFLVNSAEEPPEGIFNNLRRLFLGRKMNVFFESIKTNLSQPLSEEELKAALVKAIMVDYAQAVVDGMAAGMTDMTDADAQALQNMNSNVDLITHLLKSPDDVKELSTGNLIERNISHLECEEIKSTLSSFYNKSAQWEVTLMQFHTENETRLLKVAPESLLNIVAAIANLKTVNESLDSIKNKLTQDNLIETIAPFVKEISSLKKNLQEAVEVINTLEVNLEGEELKSFIDTMLNALEDFISRFFYLTKGTATREIKANYSESAEQIKSLLKSSEALEVKMPREVPITDENRAAEDIASTVKEELRDVTAAADDDDHNSPSMK
jgi:hypothetical protein